MNYTKQPLTLTQQIEILKQRGLIIDDEPGATAILDRTGYFRLADYWRPMEVDRESHTFKPNTRFTDIVTTYRFDTELKQLIFNAIFQIEITTRSKMILIKDIKELLAKYPVVDPAAMGCPRGWQNEPLWQ